VFSSNYPTVLNLFFLLAFPLTVLSTLAALRSFDISYPSALVVGLLFAFLPFHFQRGEEHLFVGVYFLIPMMAMVILWVWTGGVTDESQAPQRYSLTREQMLSAAIICGLIGSSFPYYAVQFSKWGAFAVSSDKKGRGGIA